MSSVRPCLDASSSQQSKRQKSGGSEASTLGLAQGQRSNMYEGHPAVDKLYKIITKLELYEYKTNNDDGKPYRLLADNSQAYTEVELMQHFLKNGIPNAQNLSMEERDKLTERVKFANVNLNHVTSARSNLLGLSLAILEENQVYPILRQLGFKATGDGTHYYQPGGKQAGKPPMNLEQIRVFIRENENWHASGKQRATAKKEDLFALRLWGATSRAPLPVYSVPLVPPTNQPSEGDPVIVGAPAAGSTSPAATSRNATEQSCIDLVSPQQQAAPLAVAQPPVLPPTTTSGNNNLQATVGVAPTAPPTARGHRVSLDGPAAENGYYFEALLVSVKQIYDSLTPVQQTSTQTVIAMWPTNAATTAASLEHRNMDPSRLVSFSDKLKQVSLLYKSMTSDDQEALKLTVSMW